MVIEMLAQGILIRPLSVYNGRKIEIYRANSPDSSEIGRRAVLAAVDDIKDAQYDFETILYMGFVLIPMRLVRGKGAPVTGVPDPPQTEFQKFCYSLAKLVATATLMRYWTGVLKLLSRDRWIQFTQNVNNQVELIKKTNGIIQFEEFVDIVEKEMVNSVE